MGPLARLGSRLFGGAAGAPAGRGGEAWPDPGTPIGEVRYVVFDTELTGLDPRRDSIVAIGALRMEGSRILVGERLSRIVRSRTELTRGSVVIHGITPSESREGPEIASVLPEFTAFCRGRVLVGHAVSIDLAFLRKELRRVPGASLPNPAVDTIAVHGFIKGRQDGRCAFHGGENGRVDLYTLAREQGIPVGRAHDALGDAFVTAQLFQRHLATLPGLGVRTLGELLRVGKP